MADRRPLERSARVTTTTTTTSPAADGGSPLRADLTHLLASLDRFLAVGRGGDACWVSRRFGEHLGLTSAERAQPQRARLLRTAAVLSLGDTPHLGHSEARALMRTFYRHDQRRLALLDALLAAPLTAVVLRNASDGTAAVTLEAVGIGGAPLETEVAHALWLADDGLEPLVAAEGSHWLAWLIDRRLMLAAARLDAPRHEHIRALAAQRLVPPSPDQATQRRFWQGMIEPLLAAALAPASAMRGPLATAGRAQPVAHLRKTLRRWLAAGLERLPLEASLPPHVRPSQLAALQRLRSLRWELAEAVDPAPLLATLEPLFVQLRYGLLPPTARDFALGPRDPRLDAWVALDEVPTLFGFASDGTHAAVSELDSQAAPLSALGLGSECAVYAELPATARIQPALRWAEARPGHPDTARIGAAYQQYRAERRYLAAWQASATELEASERYAELLYVAASCFPPSVAAAPLDALPLDRAVRGRLLKALRCSEATLGDLPPRYEALLALPGIGSSTATVLQDAVVRHLGTWRGQPRGPARRETYEAAAEVLGDGLGELERLFAAPAT